MTVATQSTNKAADQSLETGSYTSRCSAFLLNNHAFEPRLVEPKSPLP